MSSDDTTPGDGVLARYLGEDDFPVTWDAEAEQDLFWVYDEPLSDGRDVQGLLGVYAERLDVAVDGVPQPRHG